MCTLIKNRSEILFLYDVTNANPNGDPLDENKPRIDEETGINIVTDVRLKRTIRDYLFDYKKQDVFIREIRDDKGNLVTKEGRLEDFQDTKDIINKCIDVRLFGATTAVKEKTMTLIGPVQFKYGYSLHRVDLTYIKGTTVMPSGEERRQGTFTEKYILPYSLLVFYGVVNENAAQNQSIPLTDNDILLMLEAMWNGTKNLMSTSKMGQMPRFLLRVVHKETNYHIGELDKRIRFKSDKSDEEIRDISDGVLDITELVDTLEKNKESISEVQYKIDDRVILSKDGKDVTLEEALSSFNSKLKLLNF